MSNKIPITITEEDLNNSISRTGKGMDNYCQNCIVAVILERVYGERFNSSIASAARVADGLFIYNFSEELCKIRGLFDEKLFINIRERLPVTTFITIEER